MFKFYLNLAAKNLWRHKRRTILTALAIAVGVFYYIFLDSMLAGMYREGVNNIIDFQTGHIQVVASARQKSDDDAGNLKNLLPEGKTLVASLRRVNGVSGATGRLEFSGTVLNGIDELPVMAVGVGPESDLKVFQTANFIKTGRWLKGDEAGVVLGQRIAELLELKVGDTVVLRTQTKQLSFQAVDLTIVGTVATTNPEINSGQIFIPLDMAQTILGTGDALTRVYLRAENPLHLEIVSRFIVSTTGDLHPHDNSQAFFKIQTWKVAAADYLAYMASERASDTILLLIVFVISVIGIVNTILLASLERVREIGILKAMGMVEKEIIRLFVYEGLGLGLLGGVIGLLLGVAGNFYLVNIGLDITAMYGDMDIGFPISNRIHGEWNWLVILTTLLCGLLISYLASFFPARKAAKLNPVEGLRRI
jgi:putative ABC transport system permease protein